MTTHSDERAPLRAEDEAFVERLAAGFAPEPITPARRAAFDDALAVRTARPHRSRWLAPAFATAVAAAAIAWLVAPGRFDPATAGRVTAVPVTADASGTALWERELFEPEALADGGESDDLEQLPDDYAAIALAFLDG